MRLRHLMAAIATVSAFAGPALAQPMDNRGSDPRMAPDSRDMSRPDRLDSRDRPMVQDGTDRREIEREHLDQRGDTMDRRDDRRGYGYGHRRWHHGYGRHCRTVWHHHHRVRQCW